MEKILCRALWIVLFLAMPLRATIFEDFDTHRLIKCQFSSVHQNRIAVDGSKIKKVIVPGDGLTVSLEEECGQVFVYSLSYRPSTTTLSIVTECGSVQDVEISFAEKSAEVLVLKIPKISQDEAPILGNNEKSLIEEHAVQNVKAILRGEVPAGYHSCNVFRQEKSKIGSFLSVELTGKFVGAENTIYVWKAKNSSNRSVKLSEEYLNINDGDWVYLEKDVLRPKEATFLFVSGA